MDEPTESYRVLTGTKDDPTSDAGRGVFASLFEERPDPATIRTFPVVFTPGSQRNTHRHTAAVAACVVSGSMTFVFGADGTGRVELQPGDYVWIRAGVMHDEETSDGAEMVVAHLGPFETLED